MNFEERELIKNQEIEVKKKVSIHDLSAQISLTVVVFILITAILLVAGSAPRINDIIKKLNYDYLMDAAKYNGNAIDLAIDTMGTDILSNTDALGRLVGEIKMDDTPSCYGYVVDFDGVMLYHKDAAKIGTAVENEAVKSLVSSAKNGKILEQDVIEYEYNGVIKCASFYMSENRFIVVTCADKKEFFAAFYKVLNGMIILSLIIIVMADWISFFSGRRIAKPIIRLTYMINDIANLDFSENDDLTKLANNKSEIGDMSRAMIRMKICLTNIVKDIKSQSQQLFEASSLLDKDASTTSNSIGNVEIAVHEIATGATSQAQETAHATEDIVLMGEMIEDTNAQVVKLNETAELMKKSSKIATDTLKELDEINKKAIESINTIYEQTNTTNTSALKIKDATTLIASIAEETNLLSLNASIEAARAGEAGRGFAVVAAQIQKLAEQSNESAKTIEDIIHTLLVDSENAVETMEEVKNIMVLQNENVAKTGNVFEEVQIGIGNSIGGVDAIKGQTDRLNGTRSNIVDTVQSLTAIAEENAASTEETSASVIEISEVIRDITGSAEALKTIAAVLDENVSRFKL